MSIAKQFVAFFRDSSPYIHRHRGKTFVVAFGGETVEDASFTHLTQDFVLLNGLGVRLVLVHGIRPQIERRLSARGIASQYHRGLRVTTNAALECVKEAAGAVRLETEAWLTAGLMNSPMAGVKIRVTSGNFVTAQPLGVHDGVDYEHTGLVRRVDAEGISLALSEGNVVILSPVGYSSTGELFNLGLEDVAATVAVALKADKLVILHDGDCEIARRKVLQMTSKEVEHELNAGQMDDNAPSTTALRAAVAACNAGIPRAHILNWRQDGAVLLELFTRDGVGALISSTPFEALRAATVNDLGGIMDLIQPLEANGVLALRTRERLETEIAHFSVLERDQFILGCVAVYPFAEQGQAELACLALHPDYRGEGRGARLLLHAEKEASKKGCRSVFALTTQTEHWFREHGYNPATVENLPKARQDAYDSKRKSLILIKQLDIK